MRRSTWLSVSLSLLLMTPAVKGWAQDDGTLQYVPVELEVAEQVDIGWTYGLRLGLSSSFANASNVIGNSDGSTWTLGFNINGDLGLYENNHEWRNTLLIADTFTRTPIIDEFVKAGDVLDFESMYLYHIPSLPWFGPFARFRLLTSIFAGQDVRASDVTYDITYVGGAVGTVTSDRLDLTDPFQPLTLKESIGVFARPLAREDVQLEILLGFGVRQTFAADQLVVQDAAGTPEIEVVELDDFIQAGAETSVKVWGEVLENRIAYNAGAEVMIPFINSLAAGDDRSAFELTNLDLLAGLSFHLVEWASLDYQFRAVREPQLLDKFQIQNNLLLTIGYTFFERNAEEAQAEADAEAAAQAEADAEAAAQAAAEEAVQAQEIAEEAEESVQESEEAQEAVEPLEPPVPQGSEETPSTE